MVTLEIKEEEKLELQFNTCPCGSDDTMAKRLFKNAKVPGMPEGVTALRAEVIPIPSSTGLVTGEVLVMLYDTCAKCGQSFMVMSKKQRGQVQMKEQSPLIR